jgi:hypothetical protein
LILNLLLGPVLIKVRPSFGYFIDKFLIPFIFVKIFDDLDHLFYISHLRSTHHTYEQQPHFIIIDLLLVTLCLQVGHDLNLVLAAQPATCHQLILKVLELIDAPTLDLRQYLSGSLNVHVDFLLFFGHHGYFVNGLSQRGRNIGGGCSSSASSLTPIDLVVFLLPRCHGFVNIFGCLLEVLEGVLSEDFV